MRVAIAGRDEIDALHRNAINGVFKMDADTARRCADVVQTLIDALRRQQQDWRRGERGIFGQFDSALQMESGFVDKAERLRSLIGEYVDAAVQLRTSFEVAGAIIADSEAANAAEIRTSESGY